MHVTDLEHWLEAQGLRQYARTFAANDIDLDVLGELTDADLEKLGVSLGHRRRLLRALESWRAQSPATRASRALDSDSGEAEPNPFPNFLMSSVRMRLLMYFTLL